MTQCLQCRKSSFLNSPEWQNIPWEHSSKDVYQQLYDKGFALAALLHEFDNAEPTGVDTSIAVLSAYLEHLSELDADLDAWYMDLVEESPAPLYKVAPTSTIPSHIGGWYLNKGLEPHQQAPFIFHTLRLACITVTFWALELILSNTIAHTCGEILSADSSDLASASQGPDIMSNARDLLDIHGTSRRLELATNIIRTMPYCLNDDMGLLGAQKSLFALRTALGSLRRHPGEELNWCQAVNQELDNRKGLRYAREIAKLDGKWSTAGRDSLSTRVTDDSASEASGPGASS